MRKRCSLLVFLLVAANLIWIGLSGQALAASSVSLNYNQSLVNQVGKQARSSVACLGYDYAYAQTMTSGVVHHWYEYDQHGGRQGENGFYGKGMSGSFTYLTKSTSQPTLRALYDAINAGKPAIVYVTQRNGGQHWVTIVGYTNVSNPNSLSMGNFLMLDPVYGASKNPENFTTRGYALRSGSNNVRVSKASVGTTSGGSTGQWGSQVADITGSPVKIRLAANANLVVDNSNSSSKGANVHLWSDGGTGAKQQIWTFDRQGDGSYKIKSSLSGLVLDIEGGKTSNGANVWQWTSNSAPEECWYVERLGNGAYALRNKKSGLYMNLASASGIGNGTNITLWQKGSQRDQTFLIDPIDSQKPVISDVQISNVTSDGYTVSCRATDNVGVTRVQFPTWTSLNGQDDIIGNWPTNPASTGSRSGDMWTYQVRISDHNGERAVYNTHIYAYDAAGNSVCWNATGYGLSLPEPVSSGGQTPTSPGTAPAHNPGSASGSNATSTTIPLYRVYNRWSGEHLFTANESEYDGLGQIGWSQEGVAWQSPSSGQAVYRLYNPYSGDHFYTMDQVEYDKLGAIGWNQEGVAFYSEQDPVCVTVYRLYNPWLTQGTHLFTTDYDEYVSLCNIGWSGEGAAFYGVYE